MNRKVKTILFTFLLAGLSFSVPVHAYIDPATTTYIIQIVTALVITLGVTIGVFFTRVRLSIVGLYVRISEFFIRLFSKKKGNSVTTSRTHLRMSPPAGDKQSFRSRLLSSVCVSVAFAFTFIVFGIYELYMLNVDYFNFPLKLLLPPLLLFGALVAVILCGFLILFREHYSARSSLLFSESCWRGTCRAIFSTGISNIDWRPDRLECENRRLFRQYARVDRLIGDSILLKAAGKKIHTVTIRAVSTLCDSTARIDDCFNSRRRLHLSDLTGICQQRQSTK